ncbi:MAG: hypothetical protein DLM68_06415 [Hyphomicrobiales bacterium]|nr:MAG: hypothetical protein DLM68_06415 [Hyphomicrobiales bacterium]
MHGFPFCAEFAFPGDSRRSFGGSAVPGCNGGGRVPARANFLRGKTLSMGTTWLKPVAKGRHLVIP